MKRLLPALALALLALPAPAFAKELKALTVCGTNGCNTTRDRSELSTAMEVTPMANPDEGGAFYRLRLHIGEPGRHDEGVVHSAWIPSLGLLRAEDGPYAEYSLPRQPTARVLRRLSAGLHPFGAAKLGPIGGQSQSARVDEVVAAPKAGDKGGGGGGDSNGWFWAVLAIPAAVLAFLFRRRRGRRRQAPSPA
jgi:hypothetical protein